MHAIRFTSSVFLHPLSSPITAAGIHTLAIPLLGSHAFPLLSQSLGCGALNSVHHLTLHELDCKGNLFCLPLLYSLGWLLTGVPNIWDLMPDDLRWSWCNKNRNKVHSKRNTLESSQNHPHHPVHGEIVFHKNQSLSPKRLGTTGRIKLKPCAIWPHLPLSLSSASRYAQS